MKRLLVFVLTMLAGCTSTDYAGHDATMFCALEMDGQCLQADRSQALQDTKPLRIP